MGSLEPWRAATAHREGRKDAQTAGAIYTPPGHRPVPGSTFEEPGCRGWVPLGKKGWARYNAHPPAPSHKRASDHYSVRGRTSRCCIDSSTLSNCLFC